MKFAVERSKSAIIHASPFNSEKKRGGVAVIGVISYFTFCCIFNIFFIISLFWHDIS
jgi:hypothetical protein